MQYAPDSYLRPADGPGDNGTGMTFVDGASSAAAYTYGKVAHTILSGMANGKSITTEFRNIPSEPLAGIFIEASGTIGKFRANGITYAFDAQGLVAGCDAMLDGGAGLVAGGSGADWFPMAVPATNLSTLTPAVNSTPALANTIAAPGGFDPAAPGNIWSSLGTAGAGSDVYAAAVTKATVVGAVAELVRRESVTRSLSWLLTADYDTTPQTLSLVSVTMSYGTLQTFTVAENPGVAWVTNVTTFDPGERRDGQGYNEGVAWVTPATTFTPGGANNGPNPGVAWVTPATTFTPGARTDGVGFNPGVAWVTPATTFTPGMPDPAYSSIGLLLQFGGANNSTTFTDSGPLALTATVSGDAKISTTGGKFDGNCGTFDGNGDYLVFPSTSVPRFTGDFTIETWAYPTDINNRSIASSNHASDANVQLFRMFSNGSMLIYMNTNGIDHGTIITAPAGSVVANQHQHMALCRSESNTRLFVDGNQVGPTNTSWTGAFTCNVIGMHFFNGSINNSPGQYAGRLNEFRTKSTALYTANFTPPTGPF
jgi:hypothetical protein